MLQLQQNKSRRQKLLEPENNQNQRNLKKMKSNKNLKKKIVFIEIGIKKLITILSNNFSLFESYFKIEKCILKNKYEIN